MDVLRTLLFVPGIRPNMIERARNLPADVLVLDLEDSVPIAEKAAARDLVKNSLEGMAQRGQMVFVRINGLHTGLAEEDLKAVIGPHLDGINLPKPASGEDIRQADAMITALEKERGLEIGHIRILPWIETAVAVVKAFEIATASPRVVGISFGAEDFTLDMGIQRTQEGTEILYPRAMVAVAARAANVLAIDTPYPAYTDEAGLIRETEVAKQLGYQGKFLIHPSQIEPVNRVFQPTSEEIDYARRVVEAFVQAEAQGFGATSLEGKMIDVPIVERARKLLATSEALSQKTST